MSTEKPKRGRPPLSPEERELRRIERNKRSNEAHKKSGYAAQAKYRENNPDKMSAIYQKHNQKIRESYDELRVLLPKKNRYLLDDIVTSRRFYVQEKQRVPHH